MSDTCMHSYCVAQCDLHICLQLYLKLHPFENAEAYSCAVPRAATRVPLAPSNTNHPPTGLPHGPEAASLLTCPGPYTLHPSTTHRQEGVVCCADLCLSNCRSSRGLRGCCSVCHAAADCSKGRRGQGRACCCWLLGIGHRQGVAPGACCCSTAGSVGGSRHNSSTATHEPLGGGGAGCCSCARAGCLQEHDFVRVRSSAQLLGGRPLRKRGGFRWCKIGEHASKQTERNREQEKQEMHELPHTKRLQADPRPHVTPARTAWHSFWGGRRTNNSIAFPALLTHPLSVVRQSSSTPQWHPKHSSTDATAHAAHRDTGTARRQCLLGTSHTQHVPTSCCCF